MKITLCRSTGRSKRNSALVKAWQALSQPERDMYDKKAAARSLSANFDEKGIHISNIFDFLS